MSDPLDPLSIVKTAYPDIEYGVADYNPLIESLGEIILQVDDHDYQGDSRVIFKRGGEYGLLIFGWGSCSGCDALQACSTYQDIEELRSRLASDIRWESPVNLLVYFQTHDWEGDYSYQQEEMRRFVKEAADLLRKAINNQ